MIENNKDILGRSVEEINYIMKIGGLEGFLQQIYTTWIPTAQLIIIDRSQVI